MKFQQEVKRSLTLLNIISKLYTKNLPVAFMRWRTYTIFNSEDYIHLLNRAKILKSIISLNEQYYLTLKRRKFYHWKNLMNFKFPKIKKKEKNKNTIYSIVDKINKFSNHKNIAKISVLDILPIIDNMRFILDLKFKSCKNIFFSKFKMLFTIENHIINESNPILIRNLRLNEKNFRNNVINIRSEKISPFRFIKMIEGKNNHMNPLYDPRLNGFFQKSYYRVYMGRLRIDKKKKSSSQLLLTSTWNSKHPFLKFRDILMFKIFMEVYYKRAWEAIFSLRENKYLSHQLEEYKNQVKCREVIFKNIWGKIWFYCLSRQQVYIFWDNVIRCMEINKRVLRLVEERRWQIEKDKNNGIILEDDLDI